MFDKLSGHIDNLCKISWKVRKTASMSLAKDSIRQLNALEIFESDNFVYLLLSIRDPLNDTMVFPSQTFLYL